MHGVTGKPPRAAQDNGALATSRTMLLLLVAMTGVAPISLYLLVPALPVLASTFGRDISIAQMTVSLYMVGIACSQIIMGPLSNRFGRRPVLLAGLGLMGRRQACRWRQHTNELPSIRISNSPPCADTASRSRGSIRPSFAGNFLTLRSEGAGNAGRPMRPLPRVQW
jgi:hypothetical protein